jgi:hypothetical protein
MPSFRTGRPASPALRWLVLFLCAAVFAWGLQVKLSQFSTAVHGKTDTKLVQDWRGDNKPGAMKFFVVRPTHRSAHLLSVQIAVTVVAPRFLVPGIRPPHEPVTSSIAACPLALFSRPPPQNA